MDTMKANIFEPYASTPYYKNDMKSFLLNCSRRENILLTKKGYGEYQNLINSLLNQKEDTKLNGKIYLGKLSSLPRHKIKDYFKENNINKTSRLEQSHTLILNKEYLIKFKESHKRFKPSKIYKFNSEQDKNYIKAHTISSWGGTMENNSFEDTFIIRIDEYNKSNITPQLIALLQGRESEDLIFKDYEIDIAEVCRYLDYILKNPHVKVIFDENLMDSLNKDGFELDEEYLSALDDMFESNSQDNINLALEMLSNVNIEKNSLTIALFLNKHNNKFIWGSGLSLNNTPSFKSTLKYFKSKKIFFEKDWREFSVSLYKLHKNNPKNLEIINNFIKQNINLYLKDIYKDGYIELIDSSLAFRG